MEKLIEHGKALKGRVVIDDEADFASPDTKVNKDGDVVSKNKLQKRLAGMHLDETNLHHSNHYEETHGLNYQQNTQKEK